MWPFATALLASLGRVPMAGPTAVPLAVRIAPPRPRSRPPLALAPSGIDALDLPAQAAVFAGCYGALGVGTLLNVKLFDVIGEAVSADTQENLARAGSLLGILFIGAGITHFTNAKNEYVHSIVQLVRVQHYILILLLLFLLPLRIRYYAYFYLYIFIYPGAHA